MTFATPMRVEYITLPTDDVPFDVLDLLRNSEASNVEHGLPWLNLVARHASCASSRDVLVVCRAARPDERFLVVPLRLNDNSRVVQTMGDPYSSVLGLAGPGDSIELAGAIFSDLHRNGFAFLSLHAFEKGGTTHQLLWSALSDGPWQGVHSYEKHVNWYQPVDQMNHESYFRSLPSRLQNTVKRRRKKLFAVPGVSLNVLQGSAQSDLALELFLKVYQSSWKPEEAYPGFIPALVELAASRNWLRMGVIRHKGDPIAAQLWLVSQATAAIFKLAHDSEWSRYSPGSVLTDALMRHVIDEDKVEVVDFLTGDDEFKRSWMQVSRQRIGLAGYNIRSIPGLRLYLRYLAGRLFRRFRM